MSSSDNHVAFYILHLGDVVHRHYFGEAHLVLLPWVSPFENFKRTEPQSLLVTATIAKNATQTARQTINALPKDIVLYMWTTSLAAEAANNIPATTINIPAMVKPIIFVIIIPL